MINRFEAKRAARDTMRTALANPMLVSFVYIAILFGCQLFSAFLNGDIHSMLGIYNVFANSATATVNTFTSPTGIFTYIFILLINIVLGAGFTVYCLGVNNGEQMPVTSLFDGFSIVGRIILLNIVMYIFIWLWMLLFIIPGFVAVYRYRFALYNLLENPEIGVMEAIRMSKMQTYGFKMSLFVLDLSFLGWTILDVFTLGFLGIWLLPYMQLTDINFYRAITKINVVHPNIPHQDTPDQL